MLGFAFGPTTAWCYSDQQGWKTLARVHATKTTLDFDWSRMKAGEQCLCLHTRRHILDGSRGSGQPNRWLRRVKVFKMTKVGVEGARARLGL